MTNLHFCESCNKLRLTCDGKLRPCLGSYLEFDIMKPLRAGASDEELSVSSSMSSNANRAARLSRQLPTESQDGRDRRLNDESSHRMSAADGSAQMVDVSAKPMSARVAYGGRENSSCDRETIETRSRQDQIAKGNVFATARIAGIQAAKANRATDSALPHFAAQ